ncbi:hypothetical protein [Xanthobacter sp. ZOL 2024]
MAQRFRKGMQNIKSVAMALESPLGVAARGGTELVAACGRQLKASSRGA